jgi:hypothetical protein
MRTFKKLFEIPEKTPGMKADDTMLPGEVGVQGRYR